MLFSVEYGDYVEANFPSPFFSDLEPYVMVASPKRVGVPVMYPKGRESSSVVLLPWGTNGRYGRPLLEISDQLLSEDRKLSQLGYDQLRSHLMLLTGLGVVNSSWRKAEVSYIRSLSEEWSFIESLTQLGLSVQQRRRIFFTRELLTSRRAFMPLSALGRAILGISGEEEAEAIGNIIIAQLNRFYPVSTNNNKQYGTSYSGPTPGVGPSHRRRGTNAIWHYGS